MAFSEGYFLLYFLYTWFTWDQRPVTSFLLLLTHWGCFCPPGGQSLARTGEEPTFVFFSITLLGAHIATLLGCFPEEPDSRLTLRKAC